MLRKYVFTTQWVVWYNHTIGKVHSTQRKRERRNVSLSIRKHVWFVHCHYELVVVLSRYHTIDGKMYIYSYFIAWKSRKNKIENVTTSLVIATNNLSDCPMCMKWTRSSFKEIEVARWNAFTLVNGYIWWAFIKCSFSQWTVTECIKCLLFVCIVKCTQTVVVKYEKVTYCCHSVTSPRFLTDGIIRVTDTLFSRLKNAAWGGRECSFNFCKSSIYSYGKCPLCTLHP